MRKLWKKIKYEIYWRRIWWFFYSRRTTWGVQWYWDNSNRWRMNYEIADKVFFRKKSAEKYWDKIKDNVRKDQQACLWQIIKGDYKKELETVNY